LTALIVLTVLRAFGASVPLMLMPIAADAVRRFPTVDRVIHAASRGSLA
jgi:hypothetical protein